MSQKSKRNLLRHCGVEGLEDLRDQRFGNYEEPKHVNNMKDLGDFVDRAGKIPELTQKKEAKKILDLGGFGMSILSQSAWEDVKHRYHDNVENNLSFITTF